MCYLKSLKSLNRYLHKCLVQLRFSLSSVSLLESLPYAYRSFSEKRGLQGTVGAQEGLLIDLISKVWLEQEQESSGRLTNMDPQSSPLACPFPTLLVSFRH